MFFLCLFLVFFFWFDSVFSHFYLFWLGYTFSSCVSRFILLCVFLFLAHRLWICLFFYGLGCLFFHLLFCIHINIAVDFVLCLIFVFPRARTHTLHRCRLVCVCLLLFVWCVCLCCLLFLLPGSLQILIFVTMLSSLAFASCCMCALLQMYDNFALPNLMWFCYRCICAHA